MPTTGSNSNEIGTRSWASSSFVSGWRESGLLQVYFPAYSAHVARALLGIAVARRSDVSTPMGEILSMHLKVPTSTSRVLYM